MQDPTAFSSAVILRCSNCDRAYPISSINSFAICCHQPLLVEYDLEKPFLKKDIINREDTIWRYHEMLPIKDPQNIISLGEGSTPILELKKLAEKHGYSSITIKDESYNPTGSFKARGISVAISKAKELGIKKLIIPTAGNAGGALAAYAAKADMECIVIMPAHTPDIFKKEVDLYGAKRILVEGLISDCARKADEIAEKENYFNISTLKEPYRLEGKKTMGYEI